jgi:ribose 5-phosphate isomerase B
MKIGIAADHKGYVIKQMILSALKSLGNEVTDFGAYQLDEWADYSEIIIPLAMALYRREVERGIAIIGNGTGGVIIANKVRE